MAASKWLVMALALTTASAFAEERKLSREKLPAAVIATVDRETKGSTVKGFSTEMEHGVRVYEAETVVAGHTRDLQIGADGTLLEVEEEVAFDSLPQDVRSGLTAKSKGARIAKVERLTKKGTLVAYEASTIKGTHKGEIQVGPDGQSLAHEE